MDLYRWLPQFSSTIFPASSLRKLLHRFLSKLVCSFHIYMTIQIPHGMLINCHSNTFWGVSGLLLNPEHRFTLRGSTVLSFGLLSVNNCCHSNTLNFWDLKTFWLLQNLSLLMEFQQMFSVGLH